MARRAARAALMMAAAPAVAAEEVATATRALHGSYALAECTRLSMDPRAPDQCPSAGNVNPTLKCVYDPSCLNIPPPSGTVGCVERTGCRYVFGAPAPAPADLTPAPAKATPAPTQATPAPSAAPADLTPAPTRATPAPTAAPAPDVSPAPTAAIIPQVALNGNWNKLADPWSTDVVSASTICVRSVGGFVMTFDIWDTESNFVSETPSPFASPTTTCVDISDIPFVEEGTPVSPRIFISGYSDGFVRTAIQSVLYARGAGIADYTCLGSTSSFYCNLDTQGEPFTPPPAGGRGLAVVGDGLGGRGLEQFNGAFSPFAAPWSAAAVRASEVCIRNSAGYGMRFKLWDTDTNLVSDFTRDFSAGFTECLQVAGLLGAEPGHPISPRVFVLGYQDGMVQVAQQSVIYDPQAGRADYTCRGSVGGWWCNRETGALLV